MKKLVVLGISALLLSGCASPETGGNWGGFQWVKGPNGQMIPCVIQSNSGIDCDWEGFKR